MSSRILLFSTNRHTTPKPVFTPGLAHPNTTLASDSGATAIPELVYSRNESIVEMQLGSFMTAKEEFRALSVS